MARKTQEEINYWFQDNTVKSALDLSLIEKVLHNNKLDIPNNIIIHKNGNTYDDFAHWYCDETKISKYPTSYEECCNIMKVRCSYLMRNYMPSETYKIGLIDSFQKLLICRDAYWKIAGEQMGLGRPWEPDWTDGKIKYGITYYRDFLIHNNCYHSNNILVFATEGMRDAFYKNFIDLIKSCKRLL